MTDHTKNVETAGTQMIAAREQYENASKTLDHALAEIVRWAGIGGAALLAGEHTVYEGALSGENTGPMACPFCTLDCRYFGWAVDAGNHVAHLCCGNLQ